GESYIFDRVLGYAPKPNISAGARLIVDNTIVFDYSYKTDALRRRIVPSQLDDGSSREKALLIFGGSYAFGEGVNDEDALPNQLALRMPDAQLYNYAFSGYGPGQMLARLESYNLREEVSERQVAAVYLFMPNHVRRVIGAYSVISWSRHSPYYQLGEDGAVFRSGSFQEGRSGLTRWYDFLHGDGAIEYFQVDFPLRLTARHFELCTAVVSAAAAQFELQFESQDFWVVIYPSFPGHRSVDQTMAARFERAGLRVLDYSALFEPDMDGYFFLPHDPHPTPKAHRELADNMANEVHF
ncbi:MAG: hypothetical protein L3K26_07990, partial [Candidatus Hydrogenedentes bacterium]|nr:hypothetical protein [Candidatus Hydrogenedentota bacterium]